MKTIQKIVYKCEICGKEFERISEAVADEANCKMKQQEERQKAIVGAKLWGQLFSGEETNMFFAVENKDGQRFVIHQF